MTKTMIACGSLLALTTGLVACNVHDNTINIPNASLEVSTTADVEDVVPAQSVPMTVTAENVYLVAPTETPPPEHLEDAGHFEFHLDDESTAPLLVTAQTSVSVPIPAETPAGRHKIICRVHKHDGAATSVKAEVDITVKVAVATTGAAGAGGSADAGGGGGSPDASTMVTVVVDAGVVVTP